MSKSSQQPGKSAPRAAKTPAEPAKPKASAPSLRQKSGAAAEKAPKSAAAAAPAPVGPKAGDPAPAFSLPALGGKTLELAALKGKPVVLYFYPKDDTPACTQEAIDFSAQAAAFQKLGAVVIGVSRDSLDDHAKFAAKRSLTIELASDAAGAASEAYGVWVQKSMYGKTYMGLERATFLIGADGVLKKAWRKVKVNGHVTEVLAALRA